MAKINGNEIRIGNVLEHNGGLWVAVKTDHVKPGKGGAFAQVEMRNLRNGSTNASGPPIRLRRSVWNRKINNSFMKQTEC